MSFLSNNQRKRNRTILAGVLLLSLLAPLSRQATVTAAPSDVPAGFAASLFQEVWQRGDGPIASGQISRSWLWGPGPGASTREPFAGSGDGTRLVQYFDKARMELNEAVTDPTSMWRVTTGLLVSEMV